MTVMMHRECVKDVEQLASSDGSSSGTISRIKGSLGLQNVCCTSDVGIAAVLHNVRV